MQRVKFPNIDLTLPIKVRSVCNVRDEKELTVECVDFYRPQELYSLLPNIEKFELGGEYHPRDGFVIDPKVSNYDESEGRPYTSLNTSTRVGILWHSHPFNESWTSYPSIEDMDVVRMYPHLIFLILTHKGLYVISANKPYTSIDNIVGYYTSMQPETTSVAWDYDELEESFSSNLGYDRDTIKTYGIFSYMIESNNINKTTINRIILEAYRYKDKSLRTERLLQLLESHI